MADHEGFERFFRVRFPQLVRACALVTLDVAAAEEIAAEAFSRLWPRWGQMHDDDHAGGYVYTTAMRLCSKRRTHARREVVGDVAERPSSRDEVGTALERAEVFAALARLSLRQRQAVTLRDWAGFETDEVASMLGMSASTVRVHLARGRASLRVTFGVKEPEA
ncbi:MAG: sigma-70 family RNA polymerase sigma factor [Actinomycetota bacterium]